MDAAEIYAETRHRLADLFGRLTEPQLARPVAACPGWSVKDLAGHLAGVAADVCAGRLDGLATDPWTARQVEDRKARTMAEVLQEWASSGAEVEARMLAMGRSATPLVVDVVTHEHDARGAIAMPGARTSAGVDFALQILVAALGGRVRRATLPALRLRAGEDEWLVGEGDPAATVTAERFDLMRALVGRRSLEQVRSFAWEGDATPYVAVFSAFPAAAADLVE